MSRRLLRRILGCGRRRRHVLHRHEQPCTKTPVSGIPRHDTASTLIQAGNSILDSRAPFSIHPAAINDAGSDLSFRSKESRSENKGPGAIPRRPPIRTADSSEWYVRWVFTQPVKPALPFRPLKASACGEKSRLIALDPAGDDLWLRRLRGKTWLTARNS
jgi:hypothetical protein